MSVKLAGPPGPSWRWDRSSPPLFRISHLKFPAPPRGRRAWIAAWTVGEQLRRALAENVRPPPTSLPPRPASVRAGLPLSRPTSRSAPLLAASGPHSARSRALQRSFFPLDNTGPIAASLLATSDAPRREQARSHERNGDFQFRVDPFATKNSGCRPDPAPPIDRAPSHGRLPRKNNHENNNYF